MLTPWARHSYALSQFCGSDDQSSPACVSWMVMRCLSCLCHKQGTWIVIFLHGICLLWSPKAQHKSTNSTTSLRIFKGSPSTARMPGSSLRVDPTGIPETQIQLGWTKAEGSTGDNIEGTQKHLCSPHRFHSLRCSWCSQSLWNHWRTLKKEDIWCPKCHLGL